MRAQVYDIPSYLRCMEISSS